MGKPQIIETPGGEKLVLLPLADYEDLVDAAAAQQAQTAHDAAGGETLTENEVRALVAAPTPLAFWRRKRGLTQKALAEAADSSQGYIADIEAGRRTGDVHVLKRLAQALRLSLDDLVEDR